jgi:transcription initiation factor IIE alpha subunit
MSQGFIPLYRKIQDEWFWTNSKYAQAMIWLLLKANHEDKEVTFKGAKRTIKRGEHITTYRDLAEDWGCSKSTIERTLRALEEEGEIRIIETKATHIKIIKYDYYLHDDFVPMMGNSRDKHGTRESLNNNDNNDKNNIYNQTDIKSVNGDISEIMEDEAFISEIKRKFSLNDHTLENEIDHMFNSFLEKNKITNNWKASLKNWLYNGQKIEKNYIAKDRAESDAYDSPE